MYASTLRYNYHMDVPAVTLLLLLLIATPLANLYFSQIQGLGPELARLATFGVWVALPIPSLNVYQSWYQGAILHSRRTRAITEAVVIFLVTAVLVLAAGVIWGQITGLYVGLAAFALAMLTQTAWLWFRSRNTIEAVQERDLRLGVVSAKAVTD
jgi:O-antigen/teichoic acid export membrane protein